MPSSSNKRARRSGSDRGRASPPQDSASSHGSVSSRDSTLALQQMFANYKDNVINMVLSELQGQACTEHALPCPFQRRNPTRYRSVKDPSCNGRGFKDIADLRDHIKRAHSSRYGCHYCKDRFQVRDNAIEDMAKTHKKKCKYYANNRVVEVSHHKPEVMTPEQDKSYFQLDFRRSKGYSAEDKQYAQYWDICKAIWPEYQSQEAFESLDLRNKSGAIEVSRLSEIMENAMGSVDVSQFVINASLSSSQYTDSSSRASYDNSPSPRSSFAVSPHRDSQSPSRAFQSSPAASYDNDQKAEGDDGQQRPAYNALINMYNIPQPVRYAERTNLRDSAYGGSNDTDPDLLQNCWQYGDAQLGEQMLTDPDYGLMDRDIQLSGIASREIGVLSPGYQCSYGAGLDDDLMTGADGDGFYMS
ncbi:hypothetical protein GE09DRAFT_1138467 [Coniochaeta sp. 2T2.1]|nr:hypothetical protein GE09DRAFT_1138467 [Coniochaeta sp. 2T2.1]